MCDYNTGEDLIMTVVRGLIVPSLTLIPEGEITIDSIISVFCWINQPLSIVTLVGRAEIFLNADPNFFNPVYHEGRLITCQGFVTYAILDVLNFLPGRARPDAAFQQFLQIREGPIVTTRGRQSGYQEVNFRTQTTRFVIEELERDVNTEGDQERQKREGMGEEEEEWEEEEEEEDVPEGDPMEGDPMAEMMAQENRAKRAREDIASEEREASPVAPEVQQEPVGRVSRSLRFPRIRSRTATDSPGPSGLPEGTPQPPVRRSTRNKK
ncbi:uncharacterized protein EV154DRAFT_486168 [Mucor mucedo]|uniref:uncharacterized protein n=1 Tax=Mucor mucedo TaxID=29922 RepID=UPI00222061E3|nr:uncharacterized protein EV154DRAFT_486168 [Mucor mucedo]KAI7878534.1 hypothetical protein EV154DRAFT_486168 [Mucor mucedo]